MNFSPNGILWHLKYVWKKLELSDLLEVTDAAESIANQDWKPLSNIHVSLLKLLTQLLYSELYWRLNFFYYLQSFWQ